MAYCLQGKYADQFIEKLKSGEIDPAKLSNMTSPERRSFFGFLGPMHASNVNALFESKLLLKNQQQGMITWAKTVSGMKPEVLRDLVSMVNRMDKPLNPENKQAFLEDLVAHRLKARVTMEQAQEISKIAKDVAKKKELMNSGIGDRMAYGRAAVAFGNYINKIKTDAKKMTVLEQIKPNNWIKAATNLGGISRSLKASMDNSALFRQGWKTLWTNPGIWSKNAIKSFADIGKTIGGKAALDEVRADILSRPNYNRMKKAGLAVATIEEEFPSGLPEKIFGIGRVYKASQDAYTGFLYRQRADVFDKYMEIAERSGIDLSDKTQLESIGKLVNSLTGRGNLGRIEPVADVVNNIFFSPRLLKSHIDVLTAHMFDPKMSAFAKKQAAVNLLKIVSGTATVLVLANAVSPGSVEKDPKSSDYGKIKSGNTRFDVSGGMAPIITLAFRQITNATKSSTTGIVSELGTGKFGSSDRLDVLYNFFENKLAPVYSVVKSLAIGKDWEGNKPTIGSTAKDLFVPIIYTNYKELKDDPDSADMLLAMIAEGLGISTNTYASFSDDWTQKTTKEMTLFKQNYGEEKTQEASDLFNKKMANWLKIKQNDPAYKSKSEEDKQKEITKKKLEIKKIVFTQYLFKPE